MAYKEISSSKTIELDALAGSLTLPSYFIGNKNMSTDEILGNAEKLSIEIINTVNWLTITKSNTPDSTKTAYNINISYNENTDIDERSAILKLKNQSNTNYLIFRQSGTSNIVYDKEIHIYNNLFNSINFSGITNGYMGTNPAPNFANISDFKIRVYLHNNPSDYVELLNLLNNSENLNDSEEGDNNGVEKSSKPFASFAETPNANYSKVEVGNLNDGGSYTTKAYFENQTSGTAIDFPQTIYTTNISLNMPKNFVVTDDDCFIIIDFMFKSDITSICKKYYTTVIYDTGDVDKADEYLNLDKVDALHRTYSCSLMYYDNCDSNNGMLFTCSTKYKSSDGYTHAYVVLPINVYELVRNELWPLSANPLYCYISNIPVTEFYLNN